ncbi:5138_t:CDS:2, partial [Acaulospora morrowiae]
SSYSRRVGVIAAMQNSSMFQASEQGVYSSLIMVRCIGSEWNGNTFIGETMATIIFGIEDTHSEIIRAHIAKLPPLGSQHMPKLTKTIECHP